eukprot:CAMPEP_0204334276 /NCGR_PEP_ID=MMETSP0469-20131031/17900_1 /ASSEMBLY_ACC=CAM_ASM_000384 /TAXON_ID=2969 /ORGANISM="Oxyrrhis marina" /LENGTH=149 /DNA_ID=CAMNT_0051317771 /DNA_START=11 /DNA_END=460 /DNA_ORIENTATION=+
MLQLAHGANRPLPLVQEGIDLRPVHEPAQMGSLHPVLRDGDPRFSQSIAELGTLVTQDIVLEGGHCARGQVPLANSQNHGAPWIIHNLWGWVGDVLPPEPNHGLGGQRRVVAVLHPAVGGGAVPAHRGEHSGKTQGESSVSGGLVNVRG